MRKLQKCLLIFVACAPNMFKLPFNASHFAINIVFQSISHIFRSFILARASNFFDFSKAHTFLMTHFLPISFFYITSTILIVDKSIRCVSSVICEVQVIVKADGGSDIILHIFHSSFNWSAKYSPSSSEYTKGIFDNTPSS